MYLMIQENKKDCLSKIPVCLRPLRNCTGTVTGARIIHCHIRKICLHLIRCAQMIINMKTGLYGFSYWC